MVKYKVKQSSITICFCLFHCILEIKCPEGMMYDECRKSPNDVCRDGWERFNFKWFPQCKLCFIFHLSIKRLSFKENCQCSTFYFVCLDFSISLLKSFFLFVMVRYMITCLWFSTYSLMAITLLSPQSSCACNVCGWSEIRLLLSWGPNACRRSQANLRVWMHKWVTFFTNTTDSTKYLKTRFELLKLKI